MILEVDYHNNRQGDKEPHAFRIGKRAIAVNEVVDRWLASDYCYFKLAADDQATYVLKYDSRSEKWEMVLFQSDRN